MSEAAIDHDNPDLDVGRRLLWIADGLARGLMDASYVPPFNVSLLSPAVLSFLAPAIARRRRALEDMRAALTAAFRPNLQTTKALPADEAPRPAPDAPHVIASRAHRAGKGTIPNNREAQLILEEMLAADRLSRT